MNSRVQSEHVHEKALIIQTSSSPLSQALEKVLAGVSIHVTHTAHVPFSTSGLSYIFVIDMDLSNKDLSQLQESSARTILLTHSEQHFARYAKEIQIVTDSNIRLVSVPLETHDAQTCDQIIWFMLSHSPEKVLRLGPAIQPHIPKKRRTYTIKLTRSKLIRAGIVLFLLIHTLFIIPMSFTGYKIYRAGRALQDQRISDSKKHITYAQKGLLATQATYALARPGLQFTFLSFLPENILSVEENSVAFIDTSIRTSQAIRELGTLLLKENKSAEEIETSRRDVRTLEKDVKTLESTSQNIADKLTYSVASIENIREEFQTLATYLTAGSKLVGHLDTILADGTSRNYIIYFYNNMEIRPGGGFIGSFAHVIMENYTLKKFEVYDVYDADGQLKVHVRPPAPIREFLDQPHWYLRDSNFSPDFEQNTQTAEFFLKKELNLSQFDGAIGMTTTSLTYILEAFGNVYLSDFDDTINADNFYLKAQTQTETDFFPGSKRKKSFLSTVARTLLLKMHDADPARLGLAIKRSLDEKHMVFITKDADVQRDIDNLGWSGKILNPQCIVRNQNCIVNHILPVDANLGVNKANYFVNKLMKLSTTIDEKSRIHNDLSISYTNTSSPGVFPGGSYKNYMQIYIPFNATLKHIDVNGVRTQNFDVSSTGLFKIVGTLVTIPPQETRIVTVSYDLEEKIVTGENAYQIVLQKQIGAFNTDFSFEIHLPRTAQITHQNFKSVAKNQSVFYNSSLSTNKIFVIEFVNE